TIACSRSCMSRSRSMLRSRAMESRMRRVSVFMLFRSQVVELSECPSRLASVQNEKSTSVLHGRLVDPNRLNAEARPVALRQVKVATSLDALPWQTPQPPHPTTSGHRCPAHTDMTRLLVMAGDWIEGERAHREAPE